jgi:tol-pal system protein YbgF
MINRPDFPQPKHALAAAFAAASVLFAGAASAQTRLPPPQAYTDADQQQDRIEELQRELTQATAANEDLQHQLNDAQREITRLRAMVGNLAQVNQDAVTAIQNPNTTPADAAAPPTGGGGSGAPPPPSPAADGSGGRALDGAADAGGKPLPPAQGSLGTISQSQLPPPPAPDPDQAYANARGYLLNGQYPQAEDAFAHFLNDFPNADTAADARFWYAFTLLARNNYQDAAANFVRYLQAAPHGPRAPEAQVRLGMALAGMGQTRQACGAFATLPQHYPNAPRNIRDLATREAHASNCPT